MKNMSVEWQKMPKLHVDTHFAGRLASTVTYLLRLVLSLDKLVGCGTQRCSDDFCPLLHVASLKRQNLFLLELLQLAEAKSNILYF